jgi:hypothetical protein
VHPRQPQLEPPLGDIFDAAVADAGFRHDEAVLYVFDGERSVSGFEAMNWARGWLVNDGEIPEIRPLLLEINHADVRPAVRIVVFVGGRSEEGTAAIIRHELEHARQTAAYGDKLLGLYNVADQVLRLKVGGLAGSSLAYTLMPIESDANAAGAMFAVGRYGRPRIVALLGAGDKSGAALRSNVGPEPIDTLPERMMAFLIANRAVCERHAASVGASFDEILEANWPGSGATWLELVERGGLALPR